MSRTFRQHLVSQWVKRTFGSDLDSKERARRLLEEAIELAQAEEIPLQFVNHLATHVYTRPAGVPSQEAGGVSLCLLAYCTAIGENANTVEKRELMRVLDEEPNKFRFRQQEKARAGLGRKPDE